MKRRLFKIGIGIGAILIVVIVVALTVVLTSPRQTMTWGTRTSLELSGFDRHVWDHDRGHITYFRESEASGPPLIFVHGLADQGGSWHRIADEFPDYTSVVVDLPGHGDSPYNGDRIMGRASMNLLFEMLDQTFDEPVVLVGNSMGGWISLEYALTRPDRVRRLVAVDSAGLEHEIDQTLLMPENRADARRTVRTIFGDDAPPVPGFVLDQIVERSQESVASQALQYADEARYLDDRLPRLEVPVDLVWGSADLLFPLDYAERMNDMIPRSRLQVIDGCGHSPQIGCPDEFTELLQSILDRPPPGSKTAEDRGAKR